MTSFHSKSQATSCSCFVSPKPMSFQAFFGLLWILLCLAPFPLNEGQRFSIFGGDNFTLLPLLLEYETYNLCEMNDESIL